VTGDAGRFSFGDGDGFYGSGLRVCGRWAQIAQIAAEGGFGRLDALWTRERAPFAPAKRPFVEGE
jgi:hypothetical protein